MSIINTDFIKNSMTVGCTFANSHGSEKDSDYLGGAMLYYSLVYSNKYKNCLVLGSGNGFVPRILKQAQIDAKVDGEVLLVDANIGGFGRPDYLEEDSFFRKNFDIKFALKKTKEFFESNIDTFDFIHVDADHTYNGVKYDFENSIKILKDYGTIIVHDIALKNELTDQKSKKVGCGVSYFYRELVDSNVYDTMSFYGIGTGIGVVRKKWNGNIC